MAKLGTSARAPERAVQPPFPPLLAYLWRWFAEVLSGEPAGQGPARVTWTGLQSWQALTGTSLRPWEARLMVELGALRAAVLMERTDADRAGAG